MLLTCIKTHIGGKGGVSGWHDYNRKRKVALPNLPMGLTGLESLTLYPNDLKICVRKFGRRSEEGTIT